MLQPVTVLHRHISNRHDPQGHELTNDDSFSYGCSFRKVGEPRLPFSEICGVPAVPTVPQPLSTAYFQNEGGSHIWVLGRTSKKVS